MSQQLKEPKAKKTGRRGNNEGSIFQRKDKRWCGMVTVGYKTDGKPIRKAVYGSSRPEVAKAVAAKTSEVYERGYVSVSARNERNFQALMQEWFDVFVAPGIASVTEETRRNMLKNHIYKEFGAYDVGDVTSHSAKLGKTKTPKSVRSFIIPDTVVGALKEWSEYCAAHNIVSDFVFPNTKTGEMRTYSGLRNLLNRFIKVHKLEDEKITLYTFRHTFATVLLEQRENPKIVASLMGHKKVSTTLNIYSHVVNDSVYEKTAQTLDGAFASLLV